MKATEGPVLILAGAGSGKTRVLTYKAAFLIDRGISPEHILLSTFTNKAANEMKGRVIRLVGKWASRYVGKDKKTYEPTGLSAHIPFVGTFHAFCARLLRVDGKFIGIPSGYLIYDDDDSLSLVKRVMADLSISTKSFRPSSLLGAISSAKSELLGPAEYADFARGHFAETVAKVYKQYQKELHAANACDFDDLLMRTVELFRKEPQVLEKWARRFRYVLVDEYQDVNTAQYTLTKMLSSIHGNLTVVGDASQSVYSFRGADFRNILSFERDFPNAKVFNLEQNYRSTSTILSAANEVIAKNTSHPILRLWTKNGGGEKITIYNAQNEIGEANFIVETVVSSSGQLSKFAVLYRTNAQSRTVEEAFLHTNIPYKLYGGVSFYARKEIKDVMAYLRLIANPKDRVSKNRVEKLGKGRLKKFDEMVSNLPPKTPISLIDAVLKATDYLLLIDDGTEQGLMRVENVKELKSVAADFENLTTFLESVTLMEGKIAPEKSYEENKPDSVTLMTLHAAKGLEFDNVFIIGMEEGLFPHSRSMLDHEQIEEERRLAYVGMTRAKKKLCLTYATNRLYFGAQSSNLVSRFLVDIPKDLINSI
ncbi:UvrD-helicase domain-containing protein [Candidatus Curtissbacteria bacterium]|nr:UvrD-helicase domain-containing protein [Candidatus Curtissbacteria bacterium]